ncbi:MAG: RNA polymerase sigma-70 factor [Bacteroidota bacterium]
MAALNSLADNELLDLIRSRDEAAFTEIYNRYWRLIYSHVYKMLRNEDDAKDIVQETFGNLWQQAVTLPEQQNFGGYLYVSARRKVLNAMRHEKYRGEYLKALAAFAEEASEATLQYLDERDLAVAIEREIAALPPRMRQVFELSRKNYLSYKEIGKIFNISDKTVKKQVGKSIKVIRQNLRNSGAAILLLMCH